MVDALDQERAVTGATRRPSWRVWLIAAVIAALGVGVVARLMSGDDVGPPTATFDGTGVTYTGPDPVVIGDEGFWTVLDVAARPRARWVRSLTGV